MDSGHADSASAKATADRRSSESEGWSIADGALRQLDPRWIVVQRVHSAIFLIILAAISFAAVLGLWAGSGILTLGLLLLPMWLVFIAALTWHLQRWPAIAFRHTWYRVDDAGLEIQRGVYLAHAHQRAPIPYPAHRRVARAARAAPRSGHARRLHGGHAAF